MYLHAEYKFQGTVNTISGKVDTINTHIDNVLNEAPKKLKVSVHASDADMEKIEKRLAEHRKWVVEENSCFRHWDTQVSAWPFRPVRRVGSAPHPCQELCASECWTSGAYK